MARIGDSINPALGLIDYSPQMAATARMYENLGQGMAQGVGAIADVVKDRREKKDQIKAAEAKGKAVKELFGDQGGFLDSFLAAVGDEELPLSERAAMAGEVNGLIAAGIDKFNTDRDYRLQERQVNMAESASKFNLETARTEAEREAKAFAENEQTQAFMAPQVLTQVLRATVDAEKAGQPVMIPSARLQETLNAASPAQQMAIAQAAVAGMPKQAAGQLMEIPVTQNGQPAKVMARYDEAKGQFSIVPIVQPGELTGALPPNLAPYASTFEEAGAKYGIDPKFLAAISMHETGNGTSPAFRNKNNAMGISDASGPTAQSSVEDSIFKMARSLARPGGHYEGRNTIPDIGAKYAPKGAGNDPRGLNKFWADGVAQNYAALGGDPSAPVRITPGATTVKPATPMTPEQRQLHDLQVKKLEGEVAEQQGKIETAERGKGAAVQDAQYSLTLLDTLENHPGFNEAVGAGAWKSLEGAAGVVPLLGDRLQATVQNLQTATDKKGAEVLVQQIKARQFFQGIQQLKGMGALSDAEGRAAAAAVARFEAAQSEKDFKAAANEYREIIKAGIARLGGEQAAPAPQKSASDKLREQKALRQGQ